MKRVFAILAGLALLVAPITSTFAQQFDYKTKQAVAGDFNGWTLHSVASTNITSGSKTITVETPYGAVVGLGNINPLQANSTLLVDVGTAQETVTISSVTCTDPTACTFTATFSNSHVGRVAIKSGSYGLQEAIDYISNTGGKGTVIVQPGYLGTSSSQITSAVRGTTSIGVEDWSAGTTVYYGWGGSAYASVFTIGATSVTLPTIAATSITGTPNFTGNTSFGGTVNVKGSSAAGSNVLVQGIPTYVFATTSTSTAGATNTPISGLTWTIPATTAISYPFHCEITFTQATAATANAFQITTATNAPTNGTLYGLSTSAAAVVTRLVTLAYASTSATTIVSVTPGAAGTNELVFLDGFIEQPSGTGTSAVSIGVATTSGGTDITTVARDSFCRLF